MEQWTVEADSSDFKSDDQMENPDLDLPKGTRNPFLDLKSVFEFTERNTPKSYILRIS